MFFNSYVYPYSSTFLNFSWQTDSKVLHQKLFVDSFLKKISRYCHDIFFSLLFLAYSICLNFLFSKTLSQESFAISSSTLSKKPSTCIRFHNCLCGFLLSCCIFSSLGGYTIHFQLFVLNVFGSCSFLVLLHLPVTTATFLDKKEICNSEMAFRY